MAGLGGLRLELAHDVDPEPQDILRVLAVQQGEIVDGEDPIQFRDGSRVVVDADVDPAVVESAVPALVADDEEGGGLLSAAIASRSLAGIEGREEPDRQIALGRFEGGAHGLDDLLSREDVPLAREVPPHEVAGPGKAFLPRVRGGPPACIDDARLALRGLLVRLHESQEHLLRRGPLLQHREGLRPVGVRLRRDGPDPRERERDDGPDGDEFRLNRDSEILRLRIEGDDAEGGRRGSAHRTDIGAELFRRSRNP